MIVMAAPDPDPRELLAEVLIDLKTTPMPYSATVPSQLIAAAAITRAVHVVTDIAALTSRRR